LVRRYWSLIQARRWADVQALLAAEAECRWPVTRERFVGAAAIVHVNTVYPEGWTIHLLDLNALADERIHTLVRVDQGVESFYANSFFRLAAERIAAIEEFWADVQPPPAWRRDPALALPGCEPTPADLREGLNLSVD
jgi:hypothetical protein